MLRFPLTQLRQVHGCRGLVLIALWSLSIIMSRILIEVFGYVVLDRCIAMLIDMR